MSEFFLRPSPPSPPKTRQEMVRRARELAGRTVADIADQFGLVVPPDLKRHKGWLGCLVETALGADATSRDVPDFRFLGVELKTIPVDRTGKPFETTFVCTVPMAEVGEGRWEESRVKRKLAEVLWVPVLAERGLPLSHRIVGEPLHWCLDGEDEAALRADWEELVGLIGRGGIDEVTAKMGRYLQIRPKAAHGRVRRTTIDAEGDLHEAQPRGFYLRPSFTGALLQRAFAVARPAVKG
ncbi:MAG: DNA mismatch repair endonuclease MutH [Myxococcota bacterium]